MSGSLAIQLERLIDDFESGSFLNSNGVFPDKSNYVSREHVMKIWRTWRPSSPSSLLSQGWRGLRLPLPQLHGREEGGDPDPPLQQELLRQVTARAEGGLHRALRGSVRLSPGRNAEAGGRPAGQQQDFHINWGPWSGKTTTLKAVKEFIDYLVAEKTIKDGSVTLLAPTGKASRRMAEVLDCPAETIHRKLGIKGVRRGRCNKDSRGGLRHR